MLNRRGFLSNLISALAALKLFLQSNAVPL